MSSSLAFQLVSATIEDNLPDALPNDVDRSLLLEDDFLDAIEPVKVEKRVGNGAVAFVFGRMEDGRSICVRVEGVRPKLYFDAEGISPFSLKIELQAEVGRELRGAVGGGAGAGGGGAGAGGGGGGLIVEERRFANFNGYEPDPGTASGRKLHKYYQVEYPSLRAWRRAVGLRKEDDAQMREWHRAGCVGPAPRRKWRLAHEYNVDPITRFLREHGLIAGGWNVASGAERPLGGCVTTCDVEVEVGPGGLRGDPGRFDMAPYRVLYYDLETLGLDPESSAIIQVSLVFACGDEVEKHCVCLGGVAPLEGVELHCVPTEEALLHRVRRVVLARDPDFVVAYNGVNFDNNFLAVRASRRRPAAEDGVDPFFYLSRFALRPSHLRELSLASSGMGDNQFKYLDMAGRSTIDFFVKFKVDEPSEVSWSLSHFVCKYVPGDDKEEMDYREIPVLQAGSDVDRRRLASYCVHDSFLLHRLNRARNILVIVLQFAQVFGVLPEWVYFRGQQVRFVSQLLEAVRTLEAEPLLIQTPPGGFVGMYDDKGFEGATVNDPLSGFYDEDPVAVLDWKSLYPSLMLAHNLCHSTHVVRPDLRGADGVVAHRVRSLGTQWREVEEAGGEEAGGEEGPLAPGEQRLVAALSRARREAMLKEEGKGKGGRGEGGEGGGGAAAGAAAGATLRTFSLSAADVAALGRSGDGGVLSALTPATTVRLGGGVVVRPIGEHTTYFTTSHRGILPRILENLLAERVRCKKEGKAHAKKAKALSETDAAQAAYHAALADVFDGRQLAIKVSANSVYGACGAGAAGKCPNKDVSETVTFEGRETMVVLKEILTARFPGIVVIYGDSVAAYTPLLLRKNGTTVHTLTPPDLWREGTVAYSPDKEVVTIDGWETWTEQGWTAVTTLVRHLCRKRMFRVTTRTGTVDVTEDHSLLREEDALEVRACDLVVGQTRLLHSFPSDLGAGGDDADARRARIFGMFVGYGSCDTHWYSEGSCKYTAWAIANADRETLRAYADMCSQEFGTEFEISDAFESSGVYELVPTRSVQCVVETFRSTCYVNGEKVVPLFVLNGSRSVMEAFLSGICDGTEGSGGRNAPATKSMLHSWQTGSVVDQKGERASLGLYTILRALGYNVSVATRTDKPHTYRVRFTRRPLRFDVSAVERVTPLPESSAPAYVYDLTTENHHFHAGVGQMIVHNTDSVMVKFDGIGEDVSSCAKLSHEAADVVTSEFARRGYPDMILEFEKIFFPYLLLRKKRYIGLKYEPDGEDVVCKGIDAKGVETERKDTLPFLKKIYIDVRDELMHRRDAKAAYACLERHLWRLIRDEVPFEDFVMSKGLKSAYKDASTQIQWCVNEKKRLRQPGSESAVGDRVRYVIVNGHKSAKTTEMAEDPDYVKEKGLKLNRRWYFEHAILTPMTSLFAHVHGVSVDRLFQTVVAELEREKVGGTSLRALIAPAGEAGEGADKGAGGGGGGGEGSSGPLASFGTTKRHVPRPPPPMGKRKKKAA